MSDEHHAEQPEVVEATPAEEQDQTMVLDGSKLMRIASMTRAMLNEAREAPIDEAGRQRLTQIYDKSIDELCSVLPEELRDELSEVFLPFQEDGSVPSSSELRIAQAQLVGWLEGLFNGIQAALFTQQMAARAQLEHMRQAPQALEGGQDQRPTGLYL